MSRLSLCAPAFALIPVSPLQSKTHLRPRGRELILELRDARLQRLHGAPCFVGSFRALLFFVFQRRGRLGGGDGCVFWGRFQGWRRRPAKRKKDEAGASGSANTPRWVFFSCVAGSLRGWFAQAGELSLSRALASTGTGYRRRRVADADADALTCLLLLLLHASRQPNSLASTPPTSNTHKHTHGSSTNLRSPLLLSSAPRRTGPQKRRGKRKRERERASPPLSLSLCPPDRPPSPQKSTTCSSPRTWARAPRPRRPAARAAPGVSPCTS